MSAAPVSASVANSSSVSSHLSSTRTNSWIDIELFGRAKQARKKLDLPFFPQWMQSVHALTLGQAAAKTRPNKITAIPDLLRPPLSEQLRNKDWPRAFRVGKPEGECSGHDGLEANRVPALKQNQSWLWTLATDLINCARGTPPTMASTAPRGNGAAAAIIYSLPPQVELLLSAVCRHWALGISCPRYRRESGVKSGIAAKCNHAGWN